MNNIKIEVISPIHIGDNENKNLSSLSDFIVENNEIKLIDHQKLENIFFENPHIMEDYIKEVQAHSGKHYSLKPFLQKYKISLDEVTTNESIPIYVDFDAKEIHPFISENGKKYLPGSTIKGAIRNTLAFIYLKENHSMIEKIEKRNFKPRSNPKFNYEDKQIFGKDPFNDILKFLQVSDSISFSENSNSIFACKTYHLKKQNATIPINYECILPDSKTEIRIKIKDNIPTQIMQNLDEKFWNEQLSIPKIFEALNMLSTKFIEREIGELSDVDEMKPTVLFYQNLLKEIKNSNNRTAYFCIGKGTTIMEKTILLTLSIKELQNLRNKMKDTKAARNFGWKFVAGKGMLPTKLPVTRLVYKKQSNWLAGFGWLKMEER